MSVFNGEVYLRQAVDSILNQTFLDFEFLIINDYSTDSSRDIILGYSDPRIRLVDNAVNLGLANSLSKGLSLAKGEYIARQDADDLSLPLRLEKEVRFLESNRRVGLVGSYFIAINEAGEFLQYFRPPIDSDALKRKLLVKNPFAHGTVMLRKECIEKVGPYREELKHCEDHDLWLRVSQFFDLANLPSYLYQWRLNVNSVSVENKHIQDRNVQLALALHQERLAGGQDQIQKGEFDIKRWTEYESNDGDHSLKKGDIVQAYHFQGSSFLLNNRHQRALDYYFKALKIDTFNIKTWFLLFVTLIKSVMPNGLFQFCLRVFSRLQPRINY